MVTGREKPLSQFVCNLGGFFDSASCTGKDITARCIAAGSFTTSEGLLIVIHLPQARSVSCVTFYFLIQKPW